MVSFLDKNGQEFSNRCLRNGLDKEWCIKNVLLVQKIHKCHPCELFKKKGLSKITCIHLGMLNEYGTHSK